MKKNYTVADFKNLVAENWPDSGTESWDRVGLVAGHDSDSVQKIMLAVDVTREIVAEALDWGADLLFAHHPLLLRGVHTLAGDTSKGSTVTSLIRAKCALLSAHTNADVTELGVSSAIAKKLGLQNVQPIVPSAGTDNPEIGLGRVGDLQTEIKLAKLAAKIVSIIPRTAVGARVAGDADRPVKRVALLGGSGDSLLEHPLVVGSDVYITSDLRHHPAQEALEQYAVTGGPALIDIPHWASESVWLDEAADMIATKLPGVETKVSKINTDPWSFRVG